MIQIKNLTKKFDNFLVLNDLNLNVSKGSIYGLIGVNGSGKTTVIKHIAGLYRQDKGTVLVDNMAVYDNILVKQKMGYIPDELFFFNNYSIKNVISFYKNLYQNWNDKRCTDLLNLFNLDKKRKVSKLSKGMQKQVAFAFVMATTPDVLLLDEPIDGLDPIVRKLIMGQILDDVATRSLTVLISSHNLKEMEGICDAVGILKNGKMIIERDIDDLKSDVHKVQIVYSNNIMTDEQKYGNLNILHKEKRGNIELLIIREKVDKLKNYLSYLNPLVVDILPLTLEEIFIYEMEGEFNEIPF